VPDVRKSYADMTGTGVSANWSGIGSYSSSGGSVVEAQYLFATSEAMPGAQKSQFGISARWVNESFTHNGDFQGQHVRNWFGAVLLSMR
jgi:O-acetylhomoserine/O-acetylserine sulfhydrylase-like pyridoxal-dependent enzyme